ncbi:LysR substrate-binding domain-containing protein [Pullulanibacillus sp. KACC 23026]|uniref:LysR substrate-binding domain-containing protein n=1 Tax=Pullulanibacillus sp. KACC 23026 TaxID=3028315 RepID=UPI0023AFB8CB|nr:LysR substrate-binding domain-containing protein [Pullulanibacillus sp. KACC 23026]WEG12585.1 LysR substrate-binding domain-containing protein [Pullulanibacillus sp. KACC 23026]
MDQSLLVFVTVAEQANFTRAADILHMTQPAVSNHVHSLEKQMGTKLLDRTNKYVKLNKAGEIVYHHAKQILGLYTKMESLLADLTQMASGALKIGSSFTFGEYILPHLIAKLHDQYPLIQPSVTIENSTHIIDSVLRHQLDIGIIEGGDFSATRVNITPFMEDKMSIVVSSNHPLLFKKNLVPKDLEKETWMIREEGSGTRVLQDTAFNQMGISPQDTMSFGSTQMIKESIEAGLGISLLSESTMRKELKWGSLSILKVDGFPMTRQFSLVLPDETYHTKATEVFITLLQSLQEF